MSLFGVVTYILMICADTCDLQAANNLHSVTSLAVKFRVCLHHSSSERSPSIRVLVIRIWLYVQNETRL